MNDYGYEVGDICNRDGCKGIIEEKEKEPCYCHTGNPPCSSCVEPRAYCEECGWDEKEEQDMLFHKEWERRQKEKEFIKTVPERLIKLFNYRKR